MKVALIYGNSKSDGFVHGCLEHIGKLLEAKEVEVKPVRLNELNINYCTGCFTCLRTGQCTINDDMGDTIALMRDCDGWAIGASVRNGYFPALYKTFYERITYPLGFTWVPFEKHILGISAVGYATGKSVTRKTVGMTQFHGNLSSFLFFKTGIPTSLSPESVGAPLEDAVERFVRRIKTNARPPLTSRIMRRVDQSVMHNFMMKKNPMQYIYVYGEWKRKGYISALPDQINSM